MRVCEIFTKAHTLCRGCGPNEPQCSAPRAPSLGHPGSAGAAPPLAPAGLRPCHQHPGAERAQGWRWRCPSLPSRNGGRGGSRGCLGMPLTDHGAQAAPAGGCDGRGVKALDSKSNRVSLRRFESCSQRQLLALPWGCRGHAEPTQGSWLHRAAPFPVLGLPGCALYEAEAGQGFCWGPAAHPGSLVSGYGSCLGCSGTGIQLWTSPSFGHRWPANSPRLWHKRGP